MSVLDLKAHAFAENAIRSLKTMHVTILDAAEWTCSCKRSNGQQFSISLESSKKTSRGDATKVENWLRGQIYQHYKGKSHQESLKGTFSSGEIDKFLSRKRAKLDEAKDTDADVEMRHDTDIASSTPAPDISAAPALVDDASGGEDGNVALHFIDNHSSNISSTILCRGHHIQQWQNLSVVDFPWDCYRNSHAFDSISIVVDRASGFTARASECTGISIDGGNLCGACLGKKLHLIEWSTLQERAARAVVGTTLNWRYMSFKQLLDVVRHKDADMKLLRLQHFNQAKRICVLTQTTSVWSQISHLIATSNIVRLKEQLLLRGASAGQILKRLENAAAGVLRAKNFTGEETDLAALILRIGGPRLLHAASKALGLPSITTTRRHRHVDIHKFIPTLSIETLEADVGANCRAFYAGPSLSSPAADRTFEEMSILVASTDETVVDKSVAYCHASGCLTGFCHEHIINCGGAPVLDFSSVETAPALAAHSSLCKGDIHYASNATVYVVKDASKQGRGCAVAALPTCMRRVNHTLEIPGRVLNSLKRNIPDHSPSSTLLAFATDGDSTRRTLISSAMYASGRALVNTAYDGSVIQGWDKPVASAHFGYDVAFFDWMHMIKRFRNALLRPAGIVINGCKLDINWCISVLQQQKVAAKDITHVTSVTDKMDVRSAVGLLSYLSKAAEHAAERLRTAQREDAPDSLTPASRLDLAHVWLNFIIRPYLAVLLPHEYISATAMQPTKIVVQHQCHMFAASAAAAAIVFHQSADSKTGIPAVLFHDLVQNAMMVMQLCLATHQWLSQAPNRRATVALALMDTNGCEDLFSFVRGAIYNPNCSFLQFIHRLQVAQDITHIFEKHPDWTRSHRRKLNESGDGITLERLQTALELVNATLIAVHEDTVTAAFAPKQAWKEGVDQALSFTKLMRKYIWNSSCVFTSHDGTQLQVEELPSFLRRANGSIIGVRSSAGTTAPALPMNDDDILVDEEERALQAEVDAETSILRVTASSVQHDTSCVDVVADLETAARSDTLDDDHRVGYCIVDNKVVFKSKFLRTLFHRVGEDDSPCSRLLRIQRSSRAAAVSAHDVPATDVADDGNTAIVVPAARTIVAVLLRAKNEVVVMLGAVKEMKVTTIGQTVQADSLSVQHMSQPGVTVVVDLFNASQVAASDSIQFNDSNHISYTVQVLGTVAWVFDIAHTDVVCTDANISVTVEHLLQVGESIWTRLLLEHPSYEQSETVSGVENDAPALKALQCLTIVSDNSPAWLCAKASAHLSGIEAFIEENAFVSCNVSGCNMKVAAKTRRIHVAWHMLEHNDDMDNALQTMCGFCGSAENTTGGRCALIAAADGGIASSCEAATAVKKHKGFSERLPVRCSNDLIVCNTCHAPLFRYAMAHHQLFNHNLVSQAAVVPDAEREYVKATATTQQRQKSVFPTFPAHLPRRKRRRSSTHDAHDAAGVEAMQTKDAADAETATKTVAVTASARAFVPTADREYSITEWNLYYKSMEYERELAKLIEYISKSNESSQQRAEDKRAQIVAKLRKAAEMLKSALAMVEKQEALASASGESDHNAAFDAGLTADSHCITLRLHIKQHEAIASAMEARTLADWRRMIIDQGLETASTFDLSESEPE